MGLGTSKPIGGQQQWLIDYQQILTSLPLQYTPSEQERSILKHPSKPSLKTYIIMLNEDEKAHCAKSLRFRKQHPEQLIQAAYGQILHHESAYTKLKVYVENIVLNLQHLINFHFADIMAIIYKAFKAFKLLYNEFGGFAPHPAMIGFTQKAEVKVWHNTKYSKSRPQVSYQMMDEQEMVKEIIKIYKSRVDTSTIPEDSHRNIFKLEGKTFDQIIHFIQSKVLSTLLIPKYISSLALILESGRHIQQNEIVSMKDQIYHKPLDRTFKFHFSDPDPNKSHVKFTFGTESLTPKNSASLHKVTFSTSNPTCTKPESTAPSTLCESLPESSIGTNKSYSTAASSSIKFTYY